MNGEEGGDVGSPDSDSDPPVAAIVVKKRPAGRQSRGCMLPGNAIGVL